MEGQGDVMDVTAGVTGMDMTEVRRLQEKLQRACTASDASADEKILALVMTLEGVMNRCDPRQWKAMAEDATRAVIDRMSTDEGAWRPRAERKQCS